MEARLFVWQRSLSAFEKIYCNRLISGAANNYKPGKSDMEQYKDDIKKEVGCCNQTVCSTAASAHLFSTWINVVPQSPAWP